MRYFLRHIRFHENMLCKYRFDPVGQRSVRHPMKNIQCLNDRGADERKLYLFAHGVIIACVHKMAIHKIQQQLVIFIALFLIKLQKSRTSMQQVGKLYFDTKQMGLSNPVD